MTTTLSTSDLTPLLQTLALRKVTLERRGDRIKLTPRSAIQGLEAVLAECKPELLELLDRAGGRLNPEEISRLAGLADPRTLTRDPDPSGCPTHWQRVPELPPRGSRVAVVDESGLGNLYRFKIAGRWYLLKFLPPFDGRLSITDQQGTVRVLASLDEAASWLAWVVANANPQGGSGEAEGE